MKKYNSMYDVAFSVDHDGSKANKEELVIAVLKRITSLLDDDTDWMEAFEQVDTVENEEVIDYISKKI